MRGECVDLRDCVGLQYRQPVMKLAAAYSLLEFEGLLRRRHYVQREGVLHVCSGAA
jgi:hypothetical protein